jgi:hypothetical protein
MTPLRLLLLSFLGAFSYTIIWTHITNKASSYTLIIWSLAQWLPPSSLSNYLQQCAWDQWNKLDHGDHPAPVLEIPTVSVQDHEDVLAYLDLTYGKNWRDRPLLLKNLWNAADLQDDKRRLSLSGLLQEDMKIPFFSDARDPNALTPDSEASLYLIVQNITKGAPHKIGSQLLVQAYPELIAEVAPVELVTRLFGNHFRPDHLLGIGGILPGTTTVPIFVATGKLTTVDAQQCTAKAALEKEDSDIEASCYPPATAATDKDSSTLLKHPVTGLHCEPIGNVAVQLAGAKFWTLIDPQHSFRLLPTADPNGRAFFASLAPNVDHVPRYYATTQAGDAIWVPTWTWHSVQYFDEEVAFAASLFHFRAFDYVRRNPLFGTLLIPAVVKELLGMRTQ